MGIECGIHGTEVAHVHSRRGAYLCARYRYLSHIRGEIDAQSYDIQDFVVIEVRLLRQNGEDIIRDFDEDSLVLRFEVGSHHVADRIGVHWPRPSWNSGTSRPGTLPTLAQEYDEFAVVANNVPLGVEQSVRIIDAASSAVHGSGNFIQGHGLLEEVRGGEHGHGRPSGFGTAVERVEMVGTPAD